MKQRKNNWTNEQLVQAVKDSLSYAQVIKKLGLIPAGGNYETIKRKITELNLDISHMTGKGWNVGLKFIPNKPQPLSEILVKNSTFRSADKLRKRLLKEKIKHHKCECCGRKTWKGRKIPLELHHINGIRNDNRIENLQLLCPNCHALTNNYRGRNIGMSAQVGNSCVDAA